MSESTSSPLTVALIGNPNTGKSTLFSALVGVRQRVGNYPGVTVEKKIGHATVDGRKMAVVDLPGTYSLAPRSADEMIAVDMLLARMPDVTPDAVICIIDAANLERNLYLVSQVLEAGLPTIVALNMIDLAESDGTQIDAALLEKRLGVPVVPIQANRRKGLDVLKSALVSTASSGKTKPPASPFPESFQGEVEQVAALLSGDTKTVSDRFIAERMLLDTSGYMQQQLAPENRESVMAQIGKSRARLAEAGCEIPAVEAISRYQWVARVTEGVVKRTEKKRNTPTDRLDRILTHWLWGTLIFIVLMVIAFQAVFSWAEPLMGWIDDGKSWIAESIEGSDDSAPMMDEGPLRSLIVDGVIEGVGGVLIFLPQILILFLLIGILEDCGYMARAAFLMDRLMVCVGLSGKSFIPLLSSFACAIPGVMAARVIENRRDRLVTILVAPLMSCAARLPVYTVLIAAIVPNRKFLGGQLSLQGITMFAMYMVGIVAAIFVALILKKTLLRGETPPFVMELPSYRYPSATVVAQRMFDRGWAFVRRAGTLIFAVAVIVWAATHYPRNEEQATASHGDRIETLESEIETMKSDGLADDSPELIVRTEELASIDHAIQGTQLRESYLGTAGRAIEPLVEPLGWDWRIGSAAVASFPAREVVVATMGIIFNLGGEVDDKSEPLREKLRSAKWENSDRTLFDLPTAFSLMVFFALCAQCAATLAVIKRETNSYRWPLFTFVYMTTLAYVAAFATYQIGMMWS